MCIGPNSAICSEASPTSLDDVQYCKSLIPYTRWRIKSILYYSVQKKHNEDIEKTICTDKNKYTKK